MASWPTTTCSSMEEDSGPMSSALQELKQGSHNRLVMLNNVSPRLLGHTDYCNTILILILPMPYQYVLPASHGTFAQLPVHHFINWLHAFERGKFSVPDDMTLAQCHLLIDFTQIWQFFAMREPFPLSTWELLLYILRHLVNEPSDEQVMLDDSGWHGLTTLSEWAHTHLPVSSYLLAVALMSMLMTLQMTDVFPTHRLCSRW